MKMTKTIRKALVILCSAVLCLTLGLIVGMHAPFAAKAATVATTADMYCDGASIRLHEDGANGIRFHVRVKANEDREAVLDGETYSEEAFKALTTGILLIPADKLSDGEELTVEGATTAYASGARAANVTGDECVWAFRSKTENGATAYFYEATAYVYNIPESSYDREFAFRGYYMNDGAYVYTENTEKAKRSLSQVAILAKEDDVAKKESAESDDDEATTYESVGYQGDKLRALDGFLPVSISKNFTNRDKYLYRVGNQNGVAVGSLFSLTKLDTVYNVLQVECASESVTMEQNGGSLQFSGTGLATVSVAKKFSKEAPVELTVEVVDAKNVTEYADIKSGSNAVLLNDVVMPTTSLWFENATLFGNGFLLDARGASYDGVDYDYQSYVISLTNANLDNIKIVGKVYPELGGTKADDYNRALVKSDGNCRIVNSYLSNCASPIRNGGDLEIINTTLKGGAFANLDFRSGTLILDNVTTINQSSDNDTTDDGASVVGLGISTYIEGGNSGMTITIRNALTQYNYLRKGEAALESNTYTKTIADVMFGDDFADYQYTASDGSVWVNAGILSLNGYLNADGIKDEREGHGYNGKQTTVAVATVKADCYVYTFRPNGTSDTVPAYEPSKQGEIAPTYSFDFTEKNYRAKTEGSNDYCYFDESDGTVHISMDEGDTFEWDTSILTVEKEGKALAYTVTMDGEDYTGQKISFTSEGGYEVVYAYEDGYNYDASGNPYVCAYEKLVKINVVVVKPDAKHAEFSFGANGTAYTSKAVTIGDKTYVMPDVTATEDGKIGSETVNGTTVYYPITEMYTSDGKTSHTGNWYACFPIFKDAVQIIDYADNGTGDAVTYNQTNVTEYSQIPSTLKATNPTSAFLYSMNATNYPPPTEPTAVSGSVCYTCNQSGLTASNERNEMTILAEYTYTDNAGTVYYYYIGYHCAAQTNGCLAEGTLITLADGTQVPVETLTGDEMLLVWNLQTGSFDVAPILFIDYDEATMYEVINLYFSDGTQVKVISEHAFWDFDLNEYVFMRKDAAQYVGHWFNKQTTDADGNMSWTKVQLTDVTITEEYTTAWSPVTYGHLCLYANGMLSMPGGIEGIVNIFEVDGDTMTIDREQYLADIATYGLFTYEEFAEIYPLPEVMFEACNGKYLKVALGKGLIDYETLNGLVERYSKFF